MLPESQEDSIKQAIDCNDTFSTQQDYPPQQGNNDFLSCPIGHNG
jgi:hypothetical protein